MGEFSVDRDPTTTGSTVHGTERPPESPVTDEPLRRRRHGTPTAVDDPPRTENFVCRRGRDGSGGKRETTSRTPGKREPFQTAAFGGLICRGRVSTKRRRVLSVTSS